MSNIDKRALREAAENATKGEWWSDVIETDGEYGEGEDRVSGYHSYAVYVGHESLLDMTNSTAACIHTEWDHDYHMAWDETAKRNAEFIAAANPANVLALLDELEAKDKRIAELEALTPELKIAHLINKFYERYPLAEFKSDTERSAALGYFMAGAELQCFGEFINYAELMGDE